MFSKIIMTPLEHLLTDKLFDIALALFGTWLGYLLAGCPTLLSRSLFPVPELWVPRSYAFLQGRVRCRSYHRICHAQRPASHLWCS